MMNDAKPTAKSTWTRQQIRRVAVLLTPWCWVSGATGMVVVGGETIPRAAAVARVGAIGGLIAWALYHAISGRADGLAFLITTKFGPATPQPGARLPLGTVLEGRILLTAWSTLVAIGVGIFLRLRSRRKADPRAAASPHWDAEVDRSPP